MSYVPYRIGRTVAAISPLVSRIEDDPRPCNKKACNISSFPRFCVTDLTGVRIPSRELGEDLSDENKIDYGIARWGFNASLDLKRNLDASISGRLIQKKFCTTRIATNQSPGYVNSVPSQIPKATFQALAGYAAMMQKSVPIYGHTIEDITSTNANGVATMNTFTTSRNNSNSNTNRGNHGSNPNHHNSNTFHGMNHTASRHASFPRLHSMPQHHHNNNMGLSNSFDDDLHNQDWNGAPISRNGNQQIKQFMEQNNRGVPSFSFISSNNNNGTGRSNSVTPESSERSHTMTPPRTGSSSPMNFGMLVDPSHPLLLQSPTPPPKRTIDLQNNNFDAPLDVFHNHATNSGGGGFDDDLSLAEFDPRPLRPNMNTNGGGMDDDDLSLAEFEPLGFDPFAL